MSLEEEAKAAIDEWFGTRRKVRGDLPARGTASAALHVLERLKSSFSLSIDAHLASGGAQIKGLSAGKVQSLLERYGETRRLSAIAGRSNRGLPQEIADLLTRISALRLDACSNANREAILEVMQRHLVCVHIARFFSARRVRGEYDPGKGASRFAASVLRDAEESGKAGAVAEHLVGAKLSIRFPDIEIRNKSASTTDEQHGFSGDFEVGDTVFHVTMSPMPELFQKWRENIAQGLRVYVVVPESRLEGARQNAELVEPGKIEVVSIERFVGTNLDELASFDRDALKDRLRDLLETYNARVAQAETDRSLLIEPPKNL